uniref:Nanos C2HC-type zinc finger 2 n=1 Tax=Latimeria chalumnae TaxID=7897 RepID=H3B539_LATCH
IRTMAYSCRGSNGSILNHEFDMWKDYLQLGKTIKALKETMESHRRRQEESQRVLESQGSLQDFSKVGSPIIFRGTFVYSGTNRSCSSESPLNCMLQNGVPALGNGICNFCKHNGESKTVFSNHQLKREDGKIACPILRKYVCPLCFATGDTAHTLKYCPLNQEKQTLYRKSGRNSA